MNHSDPELMVLHRRPKLFTLILTHLVSFEAQFLLLWERKTGKTSTGGFHPCLMARRITHELGNVGGY